MNRNQLQHHIIIIRSRHAQLFKPLQFLLISLLFPPFLFLPQPSSLFTATSYTNSIMSTNPSFLLNKINDVSFENRPVPEIKDPHYVKIQVKKTGICGSDVHYYTHGAIGQFVVKKPMVLGHESAGVIVEVGEAVTTLKVGDRVAMEPGVPSRYSDEYKSGHYNLCPHMAFAATPPYDGTLCRYYLLPEDFCVKLPDHVSLEEGALAEPLSVGVHVSKQASVVPGDVAVVFGAGPVGLLIASCALAFGATKVVAVDLFQSKLDLAKEIGITHTFIPTKGDTPQQSAQKIWELLGEKPTVAVDASGAEPSIQTAIQVLKEGGRFVQAGMGRDNITFPIADFCSKELTAKGCFRYGFGDYKLAVEFIASGKVPAAKLITHRFKFKEAEEAFKTVMSGKAVKVIIDGPEDDE